MGIFENLENLNVSENCFNEIIESIKNYLNETSDEKAHAASVETDRRYWEARNAYDNTQNLIKKNKKTNFFSDEEIEELKDKAKQQKQELEVATRKRIRDNKNQLNRDIRLSRTPEVTEGLIQELLEVTEEYINELKRSTVENALDVRIERDEAEADALGQKFDTALNKWKNKKLSKEERIANKELAKQTLDNMKNLEQKQAKKMALYKKWTKSHPEPNS